MWVEDAARFPRSFLVFPAGNLAQRLQRRKLESARHVYTASHILAAPPKLLVYRKFARPLAPDLVNMAGILAPSISASLLPTPFTPPARRPEYLLSDQEAIAALTMLAAPSELLAAPPAGAVHADADAMIVEDEEGSTLLQEDTSYQEGVVGS